MYIYYWAILLSFQLVINLLGGSFLTKSKLSQFKTLAIRVFPAVSWIPVTIILYDVFISSLSGVYYSTYSGNIGLMLGMSFIDSVLTFLLQLAFNKVLLARMNRLLYN